MVRWHIGQAADWLHSERCKWSKRECWNIYTDDGTDITDPCSGLSRANAEMIVLAHNLSLEEGEL